MTYFPVVSPFEIFFDLDGNSLEDGYIYIGEANQNPITNQITVYWDSTGLYPAAQPIRTIDGYPDRNGSPAKIYVNAGAFEDYSILINDKHGRLVFTLQSARFDTIANGNTVDLIDDLRSISGYDQPISIRGHSTIGDGGHGKFEWFDGVAPGTYIDDNAMVIVPSGGDGSGAWKRQFKDFIDARSFGLVNDGVTDNTTALNLALNNDLVDNLFITGGPYKVTVNATAGSLTTKDNLNIYGNGIIIAENTDGSGQVAILTMGDGCKIEGIKIGPYDTDSTWTDNTSLTTVDSDPEATFDYNSKLIGLALGNNCIVSKVKCYQLWRGFSASSKNNINVNNSETYQIGVWHTQFYNCIGVQYVNNRALYGGSAGGLAFSSSKKLVINGNYCKLVGTGINTGGSSAIGFNVDTVAITGNTVIARDCINLENGATNFTVTGNKISVLTNYDLVGTNGVGIANTSESGGAFQGDISNGSITGNDISSYDTTFAFGIRIGSIETNSSTIERYVIVGNTIANCSEGIKIHNDNGSVRVRNVLINSNYLRTGSRGIRVVYGEKITINGNTIISNSSTSLANYYGITLTNYDEIDIHQNKISGYGYPFNLASDGVNFSRSRLIHNTYLPNENDASTKIASLITDSNYQTTIYFIDGRIVDSTIVANRATIRSEYFRYTPGSAVTWNLIGYNSYHEGQIMTVEFDGNTTVQNSSPYILTKGGINVVPASGQTITFIAYNGNYLKEIARNF